jgi:meiotic recombination protein SPO11
VYYAHQDVFEKQEHVNQVVKHLSYLLRVPRRSLCIVSSSKGLCAGALMLRNEEVELDVRYLSTQGKGLPITEFMDEWQEVVVYGRFILVVEKETVYFRLLQEANPSFLELCVLVTGKGYPCHSTQSFLKLVSTSNPDVPIYYLGDLDPHGFDILCLYTFGN